MGGRAVKMESTEERLEQWCSGPGIEFINPEAQEAYRSRARRIADVIQLKIPDRVPIVPSFGMFPALDHGLTCEEVMFDYDKARVAWMKTLCEFEPDLYLGSSYAFPGPVLEVLDYRQLKVPGRGIPPNHVYQFVEDEYVKADEFYRAFIEDPSDFMLRIYLPRVCGALEPLKMLRPFTESFGYYLSLVGNVSLFGMPEIASAMESLVKAGSEALRWAQGLAGEYKEIVAMGFPLYEGGQAAAPYDLIGDWFRGTRGIMIDMYRHPERLIEAMERLVPITVKMGVDQSEKSGHPIVGLMLHKGAEGFMSIEQYKTFYWPTLRKVLIGLIEDGCVPLVLFEGEYTSRLEIIKDIPRGKAIYWFENVDIHQAKEILGDTVCFRGNVPITLLCTGTAQDVKDYVKMLIDVVGKDGGLMVDCGIWFDEARHENVKAMVDFTKEYGVYR
jgi:hypothetical protein